MSLFKENMAARSTENISDYVWIYIASRRIS